MAQPQRGANPLTLGIPNFFIVRQPCPTRAQENAAQLCRPGVCGDAPSRSARTRGSRYSTGGTRQCRMPYAWGVGLGVERKATCGATLLDVTYESWSCLSCRPGSPQSGHPWTRDPASTCMAVGAAKLSR